MGHSVAFFAIASLFSRLPQMVVLSVVNHRVYVFEFFESSLGWYD